MRLPKDIVKINELFLGRAYGLSQTLKFKLTSNNSTSCNLVDKLMCSLTCFCLLSGKFDLDYKQY